MDIVRGYRHPARRCRPVVLWSQQTGAATEAADRGISLSGCIFYIYSLAAVLQLIREGEAMPEYNPTPPSTRLGQTVSISIIAAAVITGLLLIAETNRNP